MEALEFRFAFHARDFDRSLKFYGEALGLPQLPGAWDRPDGKGALFLAGRAGVVEIYGAAEGKVYEGPIPKGINLALRLADQAAVNSLYEELRGGGVTILEEPRDRIWGHRSFVVQDPDEIPIHIYCELN
jgi:catechol 2,3-dioxygenase-like lactoylglutathione lyase family enzyme